MVVMRFPSWRYAAEMAFTEAQRNKILEALRQSQQRVRERGGGAPAGCPWCGNRNFNLNPTGIVYLVLQENPGTIPLSGPSMPCIVILCDNCGHTQLINTLVLGLSDSLGLEPAAEESPASKSLNE